MAEDEILEKVKLKTQHHLLGFEIAPLALFIREGSGTPLQYSCLENPVGRGAW